MSREQRRLSLTLHRPANVDDPTALETLLPVLAAMPLSCPPVLHTHPRAAYRLRDARPPTGVRITLPAVYLDFITLEASTRLVLTDFGGVQEKTTVLGVRCLTPRESTQRPITLVEGRS